MWLACRFFAVSAAALLSPFAGLTAQTASTIGLRYTTEVIGVARGGEQRDTHWIGRLDLTADSGKGLFGLSGAHAFADVFLLHGGGFSERAVGDAQVVSNIDAPHAIRPFEAWIELPVADDVRAKAGLIDLNSEFDVQAAGQIFLNSSFGIAPDYSQSGLNGPSIFPVTSPGLILALERPRWTIRAAIFNAVAGDRTRPHRSIAGNIGRGGALLALEGDMKVGQGGELQAGYWRYTDLFDRIDGAGQDISTGSYIQFEQRLLGSDDGRALRAWVRIGRASKQTNQIALYAGGGITYSLGASQVGLAIAHARLGTPARAELFGEQLSVFRAETTIELTARHQFSTSFAVQPDLQFVRHPGWGLAPSALVVGARLHFNWDDRGG